MYCVVCGVKARTLKYSLDYLGITCSTCFRMSKEDYIKYVDLICERKVNEILEECKKIKCLYR